MLASDGLYSFEMKPMKPTPMAMCRMRLTSGGLAWRKRRWFSSRS
jgi:hypothetical protein